MNQFLKARYVIVDYQVALDETHEAFNLLMDWLFRSRDTGFKFIMGTSRLLDHLIGTRQYRDNVRIER